MIHMYTHTFKPHIHAFESLIGQVKPVVMTLESENCYRIFLTPSFFRLCKQWESRLIYFYYILNNFIEWHSRKGHSQSVI